MIANYSKSIDVREMRMADLPQINRIEKKSYDYPWPDKILRECLTNKYDCYIAVKGNLIHGYLFSKISFPESHVLNLTVDCSSRGNGIGSLLLDLVLYKSELIGSKSIFLETRKTNDAAINLYNKYKFKKVGVRPNYYRTKYGREDALVYCKELDFIRT